MGLPRDKCMSSPVLSITRLGLVKQQHPREYGGAVGWWVVVGGYGQSPQLAMTDTDGVAPAIAPVRARGALSGAIVCNSVQDQGAISCSLDSTQLGTQCDVMQSSTTQCAKAGEGDRTLDIQLGKLTLYH